MRKRSLVFILIIFAICVFSSPVLADVTFPIPPKNLPKTDATFVFTYTGEVSGLTVVTPDGRSFSGSPVEAGTISFYIGDAPSGNYWLTISGEWTTFMVEVIGTSPTTTASTTATPAPTTVATTTATTTAAATTAASTTAASTTVATTRATDDPTTTAMATEETTTSSSSAPTAAPIKAPVATETTVASSSGDISDTATTPSSVHNEEGLSQTANIAEEAIVKLPIINVISGNKSQVDLWEWAVFAGACFLFGAIIGRVISVHLRNKRRAENDLSVEVKYNEKDLF